DKEIGYDENNSTKINLNEKPEGVTITAEGTYILTGTLENGQVVVDADKTAKIQIVLNGVNINCNTSASIYIKQADKVFITLANGSENILSNKAEFVAIDDNNIDGVIFSKDDLTLNGEGKLTINANFGNAIVSKDDLVITGGEYILTSQGHALEGKDCVKIADGKFTITSGKDAIHAENTDDTSLGYIYIEGGKFDITAENDGISASAEVCVIDGDFSIKTGGGSENAPEKQSENPMNFGGVGGGRGNRLDWQNKIPQMSDGEMPQMLPLDEFSKENLPPINDETQTNDATETESKKGIKATNVLIKSGNFNINSYDDSIHSNGSLEINSGIFSISSGDDAIHAELDVLISNGDIDIAKSYEGIEGQTIKILGGNINITATDDGLNASSGSNTTVQNGIPQDPFTTDKNAFIEISGGLLNINAYGDGIDSNGDLIVTGGEIYVSGAINPPESALDFTGNGKITGGFLVATGISGMAQNFGQESTQCSIMVDLQSTTQDKVVLKDSNGNEIISYTPTKEYNSVVISHPQIKADGTYTITAGETSQAITMQGIIYGSGNHSIESCDSKATSQKTEKHCQFTAKPGKTGGRVARGYLIYDDNGTFRVIY
ncbi:MAG: carbohydrate-binding domain-containing protein, partial [Oscillospiraceae bacterium]|nr:carbohydrate-binding domain-containing protein [Oscillospiraceae bacterium]